MSKDELSMLRLTTLKAISEEFDLQVSGRRKAPNVDCVASFVLYLQGYVRATTQSKSITTVVYMESEVPNCIQNLKGSWNLSFPKLFDSYRDSFLEEISKNYFNCNEVQALSWADGYPVARTVRNLRRILA